MASKQKKSEKTGKDNLRMIDKAVQNIFSFLDSGYQGKEGINAKDRHIREIINRELEISKGMANGSIVDFVSSMNIAQQNKKSGVGQNNTPNTNELFTKNINDIFGYFEEIYRNRFIEMADLKFIAKFIPALGEAVKTTLDAIVASDNIADTVNRSFEFPSSVSEEDKQAIINELKRNEKELHVLRDLKNIGFKKALVTGTEYAYVKSYESIFQEYDVIQKRNKKLNPQENNSSQFATRQKEANESNTHIYYAGDIDISDAMESAYSVLSSSEWDNTTEHVNAIGKSVGTKTARDRIDTLAKELPEIHCLESSLLSDVMDDLDSDALQAVSEAFQYKDKMNGKKEDSSNKKQQDWFRIPTPDGTKGIDEGKSVKASQFNIPGTYIKFIDAKNLLPLKVFNQVVGYYLIKPVDKKNPTSAGTVNGITSIGTTLFNSVNIGEAKKRNVVQNIVDSISDGIMQSFSPKFVKKNAEYKKMIADCIIANGLTDKDYNIQFIPAEDIIEFTVNRNEEGFGESILTDSLFPAKLLLDMIVTRILNYVNKTGNKQIAHIHKGPVNAMTTNHINRVVRDLQEQQVTFNDLLSPNLVFNKFNRDCNISLPTAKNGNHLIEFEQWEGQNIDMNPEYEQTLEKMAILGTGVPSVIMEYMDGQADFAKQIVSAHIKFAGRVATLQGELEEPTTMMYKKIAMNSNLTQAQKDIVLQSMEVKLPRPRVRTNENNGEFLRAIQETAETCADLILGQTTVQDSQSNEDKTQNLVPVKERLMLHIAKENTPFINWDDYIEEAEHIRMQVIAEMKIKELDNDLGGNSGGTADSF